MALKLQLRNSSSFNFIFSLRKLFSSLSTAERNSNTSSSKKQNNQWADEKNPRKSSYNSTSSRSSTASWINKWPTPNHPVDSPGRKFVDSGSGDVKFRYDDDNRGSSAIERIVLRLKNLGLGSDDDENDKSGSDGRDDAVQVTDEDKLGDLLMKDWIRPDTMLLEENRGEMASQWEKGEDRAIKKRPVKAQTLADLTIEETELKRLRKNGMAIKDNISVPKAGVTQAVLEKIHERWRNVELVRLKFHEDLAHDMKTGHELVERRTGGLIIWRAGSVMVVYRGSNYQGPSRSNKPVNGEDDDSSTGSILQKRLDLNYVDNITEEEAEFNKLLDGLGPRFVDWWGTGVLPIDADLLPPTIPGYQPPLRLLRNGMRSELTNAEMTDLRKLAKSLPCHFALGRNRNHQGLAAAILKLWEKSLVVKIAVKPGIQNTNNKLMADQIKDLTGGVLLLRNKFFIVMYRGKDFIPTNVAAALAEREQLTKKIQSHEEKLHKATTKAIASSDVFEGKYISSQEHEKIIEETSIANNAKAFKQIEHKSTIDQEKKFRAETMLAKIKVSMETITNEECVVFRRIGLSMKAFLPLGICGVSDGVIENMHLHWKHRELVKLISKQKTLAFIEDTARLLEYESGGILVAVEKVPKGHALIYHRGKNYHRPISIRPRNLLQIRRR